jgi:type II secretory ATPase GspE/PulE/Tfp pilus assembly ATPase PilB-like protein
MVFSTLHTNDACGAVSRLLDMGIEPFLIASSVEGLIAQRLVRVLCVHCKESYVPGDEVINRLRQQKINFEGANFTRPVGCEKCRFTGFRGRTAIYEIFKITESLKDLIVERKPANVLKKQAIADHLRTIREDGFLKVNAGVTTIDEVMRVTMEDEFNDPA